MINVSLQTSSDIKRDLNRYNGHISQKNLCVTKMSELAEEAVSLVDQIENDLNSLEKLFN